MALFSGKSSFSGSPHYTAFLTTSANGQTASRQSPLFT